MLALDVYRNDFAQSYYDSLVALSQGKPLALAEVGNPPAPGILTQQPRWTFYMTWAGMVRNTSRQDYDAMVSDPRYLGLEDLAYAKVVAPLRQAAGLPPLERERAPADFSGVWALNEDASDFGKGGAGFAPVRLDVVQQGNDLTIRSTRIVEFADDEVSEEELTLDGAEARSEFLHAPRVTTARLSPDRQQLEIESVISFAGGAPGNKVTQKDGWSLSRGGDRLTIRRASAGLRGDQAMTLVYDRR